MRVIAGTAKGRRLKAPRSSRVRPMEDRIKESVFNMLGNLTDERVLDLFAGSGSLGIEALSRGAAAAVFVDAYRPSVQIIHANLTSTRLADRGKVVLSEVGRWLRRVAAEPGHARNHGQFSLIFLDPPFRMGRQELRGVVDDLTDSALLRASALIVLQLPSRDDPFDHPSLEALERRVYGDSAMCFYRARKSFREQASD